MNAAHKTSRHTWDGTRWLFIIFFLLFAGICSWLIFHENLLHGPAAALLIIPAVIGAVALGVALFASDRVLQRVANSLPGLS